MAVIWNVRPTPRRQIWRGFKPIRLRPSNSALPLSAAIWPFNRLKQVVLPAPLGPIRASSSPEARLKLTSRTACTPP